jgi:hypothetical protein
MRWGLPQDGSTVVQTTNVGGFTLMGGSAFDASADGSVVVGFSYLVNTNSGFRWTQSGGMTALPLSIPTGNVERCSADGSVVVGTFWRTSTQVFPSRYVVSTNTVEDLGVPGLSGSSAGISDDSGTIAGSTTTSSNRMDGFVWKANPAGGAGTVTILPLPAGTAPSGEVYDLSATGNAAAGRTTATGGSHSATYRPTIWTQANPSSPWAMTQLALLPGMATGYVSAVNGDGTLAIGAETDINNGNRTYFVWTASTGMMTQAQFLSSLGLPAGWSFEGIRDVSADGLSFLATGTSPQGVFSAVVIQVPAPGSAVAIACPTALVLARRRRRGA